MFLEVIIDLKNLLNVRKTQGLLDFTQVLESDEQQQYYINNKTKAANGKGQFFSL